MGRINTNLNPADDTLTVAGAFTLADTTDFGMLDPELNAARILIQSATGAIKADLVLPGGAFGVAGPLGWSRNGSGSKWRFRDKTGNPGTGILGMGIQDRSKKTPNLVKVKGKKGTYPVLGADAPVRFTVVLGGQPASVAGQCGDSVFASADCAFNGAMNKLVCDR